MDVRVAREVELAVVMNVFDAGGLEVTVDRVRARLDDDRVLVAVEDGRVLGAVLLEPAADPGTAEIEAVAVRPGRCGQGIGTRLVRSVAARHERVVAEFDGHVRPFWVALGFAVEPAAESERFVGRLDVGSVAE